MSGLDVAGIQGIVWDLDGTLYKFDGAFRQACNLAAARTVLDMGLPLSLEEALELAAESERNHGSSFKLFAQHGLDYKEFHLPFHNAVDVSILEKNLEMIEGLEALKLPMVILTNASRTWVQRIIKRLEIGHIFGDVDIVTLEEVGYNGKASTKVGFNKALSLLGLPVNRVLMVEDLPVNLVHAKQLGMMTALIHHGRDHDKTLPHVDAHFDNTLELIRTLTGQ